MVTSEIRKLFRQFTFYIIISRAFRRGTLLEFSQKISEIVFSNFTSIPFDRVFIMGDQLHVAF